MIEDADTTRRFVGDLMLRKYGFRIEERKGDTQPKWRWTDGKVYLEEDARYIAIEESKKNVPV